MRLIHLCFQLHLPYKTPEMDLERSFRKANERIYQPFFALLERNTQKHTDWHFSLLVSGMWLELADKYDHSLIERLKKLLKTGRIELVNVPFYHSLAFFYNKEELTEQVKLYQAKVRDWFGFTGQMFAMPDFMYNDAIGKWAEDFGFAGMLVGGGENVLDFRSANHVYEAAGCEYLRLLFQNVNLVKKIETADSKLLTETERGGEKKVVFSANKFQKMLDLECLRGNLVNLYLDAEIVAQQREKGIIGFFDVLIENWLNVKGNKFVNAKEACVAETPTNEVSVQETVDWRSQGVTRKAEVDESTLALVKDFEYRLPEWLSSKVQEEFGRKLYALGKEVLASEDEDLLEEFRKYTVVEVQAELLPAEMGDWEKKFNELRARAEEVKKKRAAEISQVYTKKRDRGLDEASEVKVNFGKKKPVEVRVAVDVDVDEAGEVVEVERKVEAKVDEIKVTPTQIVVDEPEIVLPDTGEKKKSKKIKKIIKKLVIE